MNITEKTDRRAPCGFPAPSSFETLVLHIKRGLYSLVHVWIVKNGSSSDQRGYRMNITVGFVGIPYSTSKPIWNCIECAHSVQAVQKMPQRNW